MEHPKATSTPRIGRPSKVDEHGTPTRERLLRAAVDACIEFGYDGATLSDIARRAEVSTPAIYSHFSGKAALLVAASKHELDAITTIRLPGEPGIREIARHWLHPEFRSTRILITELHTASTRQPEVAELLDDWQRDYSARLAHLLGLSPAQVTMLYLLLLGLSHADTLTGLDIDDPEIERQVDALIDGWLAASSGDPDCYDHFPNGH